MQKILYVDFAKEEVENFRKSRFKGGRKSGREEGHYHVHLQALRLDDQVHNRILYPYQFSVFVNDRFCRPEESVLKRFEEITAAKEMKLKDYTKGQVTMQTQDSPWSLTGKGGSSSTSHCFGEEPKLYYD